MNDYLNTKEGGYSYNSISTENIFIDDMTNSYNKIKVALTPANYVSSEGKSERNLMFARSQNTEIELEINHEPTNKHDKKALIVSYNNINMGYIRKMYNNIDRTHIINDFCFNNKVMRKISLKCLNGTYYIYKIEDNESKQYIDEKEIKVAKNKSEQISNKLLDGLIASTGWKIKK